MTQKKLVSGALVSSSIVLASLLLAMAAPERALAWEFFRSENDHVADGNELLGAGDHAGALAEYDLAARELPSEPGVHLDRGLALMAAGDFGRAREAFMMAADPPATAEIRAMAHYNIGLTYYREGDALAAGTPAAAAPAPANPLGGLFGGATPPPAPGAPVEADHDGARRAFREAADAFRDSLRQVPGNRDAGWNLELALRRITEEDEAEERENEENEESEDGDESEESSEDGEESEESSEDGEPGDEESEGEGNEGEEESESGDDSPGEEGNEGEEGEEGEEPGANDEGEEPGEDGANDGSSENEESGREESGDPSGTDGEAGDGSADGEGSETEAGGTTDRSLSPDAERVLDALENSEENLAAARARGRGEHASRRVERDW